MVARCAHTLDEGEVAIGKRLILVVDEELRSASDKIVNGLLRLLRSGAACRKRQLFGVGNGDAAPPERLLVLLDINAVEFDGTHQRVQRNRDEPLLPCGAE